MVTQWPRSGDVRGHCEVDQDGYQQNQCHVLAIAFAQPSTGKFAQPAFQKKARPMLLARRARALAAATARGLSSTAPPPEIRFRSALSKASSTEGAVRECLNALEPSGASMLLVWLVNHSASEALAHVAAHDSALATRTLGCSAYSLVHAARAGGCEVETLGGESAVAMTAAWLPDTTVQTFCLEQPSLPELDNMRSLVLSPPEEPPSFLLFATPQFGTAPLLRLLDAAFPTAPKVGATAETADSMEDAQVFANGRVLSSGAVGAVLSGNVAIDVVASTGLRPVTGE